MTVSPDVPDSDTSARAFAALLAFTVVVGAVTFTLSFHGLNGYGHDLVRLAELSPLVPLGVDGLTLVAVAATYLLRTAPLRVRAYAWFVFVIAIAASVAGNLSDAASRHLSPEGMVGAAAWPILLALASHMVIVTRRWMDRLRPVPVPDTEPDTEPVDDQPEGASDPRPFDAEVYARRRAGRGHKVAAIGRSLREQHQVDVDDRTVGRWTEDIRAARVARVNGNGAAPSDTEGVPADA